MTEASGATLSTRGAEQVSMSAPGTVAMRSWKHVMTELQEEASGWVLAHGITAEPSSHITEYLSRQAKTFELHRALELNAAIAAEIDERRRTINRWQFVTASLTLVVAICSNAAVINWSKDPDAGVFIAIFLTSVTLAAVARELGTTEEKRREAALVSVQKPLIDRIVELQKAGLVRIAVESNERFRGSTQGLSAALAPSDSDDEPTTSEKQRRERV